MTKNKTLVERWGVNWGGTVATHDRMPDGYWTPWHIANEAIEAQAAEIAQYHADLLGYITKEKQFVTENIKLRAEIARLREVIRKCGEAVDMGYQSEVDQTVEIARLRQDRNEALGMVEECEAIGRELNVEISRWKIVCGRRSERITQLEAVLDNIANESSDKWARDKASQALGEQP